jgi:hypothetical protein
MAIRKSTAERVQALMAKTVVLGMKVHPERAARGVNSGRAKLTDSDVLAIRESRVPAWREAAHYGVSKCTIDRIRERVSWRHL